MKLNKIHYQIILEHYGSDCDHFQIWTYNDSNKAYEKYVSLRRWYGKLSEAQKGEICIKFQVCDRSISAEILLNDIVSATGFNVMDNYIYEGEQWERIESRYFPEGLPPLD
ncbi:MAG: hypothetical protein IJO73_07470 [Clostridia bacterium]|nr:hypothetical protein [Clostridia bacterium]